MRVTPRQKAPAFEIAHITSQRSQTRLGAEEAFVEKWAGTD
jgi:hypothetical protein